MSIKVIEAKARQYAFTLRRTNLKNGVTEDDYFNHIVKWENKGQCKLVDYVFEKTAGLHMHGILEIEKSQKMQYFRVRGWNIKLEELYNPEGWKAYMLKDQVINELENDEESLIEDQPIRVIKKKLFKND